MVKTTNLKGLSK